MFCLSKEENGGMAGTEKSWTALYFYYLFDYYLINVARNNEMMMQMTKS